MKSCLIGASLSIFSPHYDHGRSITRFAINKFAIAFTFPTRRGLNLDSKHRLKKMHNSKSGKTALVLGNGPSLNTLNVDSVEEYVDDVFVCNDFYSLEISNSVKADYYCLSDPYYFVHLKKFSDNKKLVKYLENTQSILYVSHFYRRYLKTLNLPYLLFNDREWFFFNWSVSPIRPRSYSSVTIYKGLALACYLGYSRIYILGIDNTEFISYRSNLVNDIYVDSESNYASPVKGPQDPSKLFLKFPGDLAGRLHSIANLFHDLRLFSKYPITNLDPNSLITSFPKVMSHPLQAPHGPK